MVVFLLFISCSSGPVVWAEESIAAAPAQSQAALTLSPKIWVDRAVVGSVKPAPAERVAEKKNLAEEVIVIPRLEVKELHIVGGSSALDASLRPKPQTPRSRQPRRRFSRSRTALSNRIAVASRAVNAARRAAEEAARRAEAAAAAVQQAEFNAHDWAVAAEKNAQDSKNWAQASASKARVAKDAAASAQTNAKRGRLGWLGLLGLSGIFALRRKKTEEVFSPIREEEEPDKEEEVGVIPPLIPPI